MAKLDDFLGKKKETAPVLDLSKTSATVSTQEEFRRMLEKVPDFKMRPEKVPPESIKLRDKFNIDVVKQDVKAMKEPYAFMNPIPVELRDLDLNDLASVSIDWRMLSSKRPKTKVEEDYFSKLVELARSERKSRAEEKKRSEREPMIRRHKNKAGIIETRAICCTECGEDFCDGKICGLIGYDAFARVEPPPALQKIISPTATGAVPKKKTRSRSKTKSTRKKKGDASKSPKKRKSKSPKRHKSKSPKKSKSKTKSEKGKIKSARRSRSESPKKTSKSVISARGRPKSKSLDKSVMKSPKRNQSQSPSKPTKSAAAKSSVKK